jgi:DNA polymerase-3 subunit chi
VSKQEGWDNRLAIVYKLVTMALQRKMAIHIHTTDSNESKLLDDFLWKHQKSSFFPHAILSKDDSQLKSEISIGHDYEPMKNCDYLINISSERPEYFSRYLKVAEILDKTEEILTAGRKRYVFYKERGYTLGYHQL